MKARDRQLSFDFSFDYSIDVVELSPPELRPVPKPDPVPIAAIEYFTYDECPGSFFHCDRLHANLSTFACSSRWEKANSDPFRETFTACIKCPIGALHAGKVIEKGTELFGSRICTRCHRPSDRLIHDLHCPSCYNRQLEFLAGKNAKGTPPVKISKFGGLAHRAFRFRAGDGEARSEVSGLTISMVEAVVSLLRITPGRVEFGFSGYCGGG